jgi:hypothetical protein
VTASLDVGAVDFQKKAANRSILLFEHRIAPKTGSHPRVKPEGKLLGPML